MQVRGRFSRQDLTPRIPLALKMTAWLRVPRSISQVSETIYFNCFYFRPSGAKPS